MADVVASLAAMGEAGKPIAVSWEQEKTVQTEDELRELLRVQMPFHFAGEPPPGFDDNLVGSPEVLRHFASQGYGDFDYTPDLGTRSPRPRSSSSASTTARRRRGPRAPCTRASRAASSWSCPTWGT